MTSQPRPEDVAQALRDGVPPSALLDEANREPPADPANCQSPSAADADPKTDPGLEETGRAETGRRRRR